MQRSPAKLSANTQRRRLKNDTRFVDLAKAARATHDTEPLKALFAEYGVEWQEGEITFHEKIG